MASRIGVRATETSICHGATVLDPEQYQSPESPHFHPLNSKSVHFFNTHLEGAFLQGTLQSFGGLSTFWATGDVGLTRSVRGNLHSEI